MAKSNRKARRGRRQQGSAPTLVRWAVLASFGLSVLGIGLALYSTNSTIQIETVGLEEASGCSINNVVNCDVAAGSSYALFGGIPVAWWGFLFYLWAFIGLGYAAYGANKETGAAMAASVWVLSIGAVLFSVYKAFHLYQLGVVCLVCVAMYGVNLGLFLLIPLAFGVSLGKIGGFLGNYVKSIRGQSDELGFSPKIRTVGIMVAAIFVVGFAGMKNYADSNFPDAEIDVERYVEAHFRQPQVEFDLPEGSIPWGNPDGPLTIVEFGDFQCPGCRQAALTLRPALFEFHQDVQLHYLHFPLDSAVNDSMAAAGRQLHPMAGIAAQASVCAQERGDFWEYHDDIYRNQATIGPSSLIEFAEERGWDVEEFAACIQDPETIARVRGDLARGWQAQVGSTPTLFINGRRVTQWRSKDLVKAIVEAELERM